MDIRFGDARLKALCECQRQLNEAFGSTTAGNIQDALWILRRATTLADLSTRPPFSRQPLNGHPDSFFSIGPAQVGQLHVEALDWDGVVADVKLIQIVHIWGLD